MKDDRDRIEWRCDMTVHISYIVNYVGYGYGGIRLHTSCSRPYTHDIRENVSRGRNSADECQCISGALYGTDTRLSHLLYEQGAGLLV